MIQRDPPVSHKRLKGTDLNRADVVDSCAPPSLLAASHPRHGAARMCQLVRDDDFKRRRAASGPPLVLSAHKKRPRPPVAASPPGAVADSDLIRSGLSTEACSTANRTSCSGKKRARQLNQRSELAWQPMHGSAKLDSHAAAAAIALLDRPRERIRSSIEVQFRFSTMGAIWQVGTPFY